MGKGLEQIIIHKILPEHKKTCFYCDSSWTLAQLAQRDCGICICGGIQNLNGHIPRQCALSDHAWCSGI